MQNSLLRGTGVALITPFHDDKSIDFDSLSNLVNYVISNNVDFLVVFGTTGEPVTLTEDEKKQVFKIVKTVAGDKLPIVIGCGGNCTQDVVEELKNDMYKNCAAILSVSPYYNKPSQEGIFQHYKAVSNASPVPVLLYNVPGRTGSNISVETAVRIARECKNVIGLKEASPSVEQFTYMKRDLPENFLLFSGDDSLLVPHLSLGASGAISVTANAMPKMYSEIVNLIFAGDYSKALEKHLKLIEFTDSLFEEGSPAGIKAALSSLGIVKNNVRLPLSEVSKNQYDRIKNLLDALKK